MHDGENGERREASMTLKVLCDVKASDEARVKDLAGQYGLTFKRVGKS
jgi:hypothetical protein